MPNSAVARCLQKGCLSEGVVFMDTSSSQQEAAKDGQQDSLQQIAAKIIQRAWRRYVCREVFRHIKNLISRCHLQDPQALLRTVNPREAQLLDAAAGVFIRFRLGGVYYKIFTYRPIVDLCASSPRDYHQLWLKKLLAKEHGCAETLKGAGQLGHLGEKGQVSPPPCPLHVPAQESDPALNQMDRSGWYQRVENNNWRLLCHKVVGRGEPIEGDVNKKIDFHPSTIQRKEDVRKWKKRRKIEWMKRMYREGRQQAHSDQDDLATLVESSAKEVIEIIEENGDDEILDWELDELLAWTNSLNFEEYMEEWRRLACSHTSEPSRDGPSKTYLSERSA